MDRLCERPGCSERASVAYGMRAEDLVFWLDFLPDDARGRGGALCRRHADSMVVPRGWTLDDLREPDLHLFRPPTQAVQAAQAPPPVLPASTARRRRAERRRERQADQLRLDAPPSAVAAASPAATPTAPAPTPSAALTLTPEPAVVDAPQFDASPVEPVSVDTVSVDTVTADPVPVESLPVETSQPVSTQAGTVAAGVAPVEAAQPEAAATTVASAPLAAGPAPDDDLDAQGAPLPPWTPDFDEADDLGGLLAARSPLLARAFRTADRGD